MYYVHDEELAPAIVEAEKSPDLQLASWGSGRVAVWSSKEEERCWCKFQAWAKSKDRRRLMLQLKDSQRERTFSYSAFCFIQTFNRLEEAHLHWGGQSASLSRLIQMIISCRNSLIDTHRNTVEPNVWTHRGPL